MATIYRTPNQNNQQYTLNAQLAQGGTTVTLNSSVAGIVQAPGVFVVDRVDSNGNKTPSVREYISFTGVSTNQLTGLSKGLAGSTDQVHSVGAIVEFVPDVVWSNAIENVILQEHGSTGQHLSLASTSFISTLAAVVLSTASIQSTSIVQDTAQNLLVASLASLQRAYVTNLFSASGASIVGLLSSASGSVLTSNAPNGYVFANSAGGTGGLNALLQIPGGLASVVNVGGMVTVPAAFTAQFITGYVQTPASVASVSIVIKKNLNTVFAVGTIAAGATFLSSASIATAALAIGDQLTMDINSTASLATDLSVTLRAT